MFEQLSPQVSPRLVVASYRGPVSFETKAGQVCVRAGTGGLVSAMEPVLRRREGTWIAAGTNVPAAQRSLSLPGMKASVVHLNVSKSLHAGHYLGFSNRGLWPISHVFPGRMRFRQIEFEAYRRVNGMFADAIVQHSKNEDSIWVHDYQLAMVPALVRSRRRESQIAFFWHIPFPPYEVWRVLPRHKEVVAGMLGADRIDFHLESYATAFRETVSHLPGGDYKSDGTVIWQGRELKVSARPAGIDTDIWEAARSDPTVLREADAIRRRSPSRQIVLGVDRLDYTKGILERFLAIERLLDAKPQVRGAFTFIQIAVPSRIRLPEYQRMRREIEETVGRINGRFSTGSYVPIFYHYRSLPRNSIAAYYLAADVALVTPLRDGMNLVSLEFVITNEERPAAIILSEFAGSSEILKEAVLVNPNDLDAVAEAIRTAIRMSKSERLGRMKKMARRIRKRNTELWANDILENRLSLDPETPYDC